MSETIHDPLGSLTYDDKVIQKIVTLTLAEITDFLVMDQKLTKQLMATTAASNARDIEVKIKGNNVVVSADIIVEYGCNIPTLYEKATMVVKEEIERMTTLSLGELHLYVRDILPVVEFQDLHYNVSMAPVETKLRPVEDSFTTKINHFVHNIREKATGKIEGTTREQKMKTKLLSKKTEGKTREFVTDLKTKTKKEQAGKKTEETNLAFVAVNANLNQSENLIEANIENKKLRQSTDETLNQFEPQKQVTEKNNNTRKE